MSEDRITDGPTEPIRLDDVRRRRRRKGGDGELGANEIDPSAPYDVALTYAASREDDDKVTDLRHWQGDFWVARGARYQVLGTDALKADLYPWLARKTKPDSSLPIKPNKTMVERVVDALKAVAHLDVPEVPAWVDGGEGRPPARDLIACRNGLLSVRDGKLLPASRAFFALSALDIDYSADTPPPEAWLAFLRELWGDDEQSIDTLQEIFGLSLTTDTSHQKAFLLLGPKRCGKGTIARVLRQLVGPANCVFPMLANLGEQFGLESMIGKTLAIIADMRLGGKADSPAIVENLLRITGEDAVSVPRKFRVDYTAPLQARFLMLSNELPALLDQSGALASRFIILRLTESFFGREDQQLTDKLLRELPGILRWSLEGLQRLRQRGRFVEPESSRDVAQQLEFLTSPINAFVSDNCVLEPSAEIPVDDLFKTWCEWSKDQGRDHWGTIQVFGRNLTSAFPAVKSVATTTNWRGGQRRPRVYRGIRLRSLMDPEKPNQQPSLGIDPSEVL